jgi:hypothetical protein
MLNYYIAVHQRKTKLSTKRENKSCRRNGKKDFVDDTGKNSVDEVEQLRACRPNGKISYTVILLMVNRKRSKK